MKSEKEALVQGGGGWLKLFFMLPRGFSPQLPPLQPSPPNKANNRGSPCLQKPSPEREAIGDF